MKQAITFLLAVWLSLPAGASVNFYAQSISGNGSGSDANNCTNALNQASDTNYIVGVTSNYINWTTSGSASQAKYLIFWPGASISRAFWTNPIIRSGSDSLTMVHDFIIDGGGIDANGCPTNGVIRATDQGYPGKTYTNGWTTAYPGAITLSRGTNVHVRGMILDGLYVRTSNNVDNAYIGAYPGGIYFLGTGTNCSISYCRATNLGNAFVIGPSLANSMSFNDKVFSNAAAICSWGLFAEIASSGAGSSNTEIYANYFYPSQAWDGDAANHQDGIISGVASGIAITAGTNFNMHVYRNYIRSDAKQLTALFYHEASQVPKHNVNTTVDNNIFISESGATVNLRSISAEGDGMRYLNNTFYGFDVIGGMQLAASGQNDGNCSPATNITGADVLNNAFVNSYSIWGNGCGANYTIYGGPTSGPLFPFSVSNIDYNVSSMSSDPSYQIWYGVGGLTYQAITNATDYPQYARFDRNSSVLTNIVIVDSTTFAPKDVGTNVLVGRGTNLQAIALALNMPGITNDFYGNPRPAVGAWTIGAVEGSSTNVTANFTGSPTSGTAALQVTFTDSSINATNWSWDFGDGGSSTSQNPQHTYNAAGTYDVRLTIIGLGQNDTKTRTSYITVTAPASSALTNAVFSGDLNIQGPLKIR